MFSEYRLDRIVRIPKKCVRVLIKTTELPEILKR